MVDPQPPVAIRRTVSLPPVPHLGEIGTLKTPFGAIPRCSARGESSVLFDQGVSMSVFTVSDFPLEADSPAQRLRRVAAAARVHFTWWGVHRTLTAQQKEEVGATYAADARFLTAGKKLVDVRHEAFRKLTSLRTRIVNYWRGLSPPHLHARGRPGRPTDHQAVVHTPARPPGE